MTRKTHVLVTCEHGGNRIPARYAPLFSDQSPALEGHTGHDPGALALARSLARALRGRWRTHLIFSTTSRLLVDLNRSIGHPRLHGEPVRALGPGGRRAIVASHYRPYRDAVERWVEAAVESGARVLHVSCHTFTPYWDGNERNADIGLLFDPSRRPEVRIAQDWRDALHKQAHPLRIRFNYPYRGTADGLTTTLRRRFGGARYAGLELEVNQRFPLGGGRAWQTLRRSIAAALAHALRNGKREARDATNPPAAGAKRRPRDAGHGHLRVR